MIAHHNTQGSSAPSLAQSPVLEEHQESPLCQPGQALALQSPPPPWEWLHFQQSRNKNTKNLL